MARIAGVELQNDVKVDYALTLIYGVGWSRAGQILGRTAIPRAKRVRELTDEEIAKIAKALEEVAPIEGELRRKIQDDIARLVAVNAYRGVRHTKSLPVRGQRTKTNARTKRGKRKTVGAFKKEALTKMQHKSAKEEK